MNDNLEVLFLNESQISQSDNYTNFKLILIGDAGVGKSSILNREIKDNFDESYKITIGFEFLLIYCKVNELNIKFQIWDTCGQEKYRSLVQSFYHNTSLAIIIYDISKRESFDNLGNWLKDLKQHTEKGLPIFIVGNKNDLERKVTEEEGKIFKNENEIFYFTECSAKSGYNVKEIFIEAAKCLYQIKKISNKINKTKRLKLEIGKEDDNIIDKKKKKKCCK